jgi:hypothetical protein
LERFQAPSSPSFTLSAVAPVDVHEVWCETNPGYSLRGITIADVGPDNKITIPVIPYRQPVEGLVGLVTIDTIPDREPAAIKCLDPLVQHTGV